MNSYGSAATSVLAASEERIRRRAIRQKESGKFQSRSGSLFKKTLGKKGKYTWKRPRRALGRSSAHLTLILGLYRVAYFQHLSPLSFHSFRMCGALLALGRWACAVCLSSCMHAHPRLSSLCLWNAPEGHISPFCLLMQMLEPICLILKAADDQFQMFLSIGNRWCRLWPVIIFVWQLLDNQETAKLSPDGRLTFLVGGGSPLLPCSYLTSYLL